MTLNGQPLNRVFIRHEEIMAGGELVFTMQATPNRGWPGPHAAAPVLDVGALGCRRRKGAAAVHVPLIVTVLPEPRAPRTAQAPPQPTRP